jgi:guanine nucleotide-binding protein G(i) subunit alpha
LPHIHHLNKNHPTSTILGLVTVVNGIDISGIDNGGGTAEVFMSDPQIALLIHPLWQDPVIPKIMNHSGEFYLMDSAS